MACSYGVLQYRYAKVRLQLIRLFRSPHNFSLSSAFTTEFRLPRLSLRHKFPTLPISMDAAGLLPFPTFSSAYRSPTPSISTLSSSRLLHIILIRASLVGCA